MNATVNAALEEMGNAMHRFQLVAVLSEPGAFDASVLDDKPPIKGRSCAVCHPSG